MAIPFFYFLHFFVISKLIDRLSEKYVSYLSDVSPARSSHANRVEDATLSLSRVRASMQNALISLPMYRPTGWKYYLGSVPRRMRAVLYRELIYCRHTPETIASLVKGIPNTAGKKKTIMRIVIIMDDSFVPANVVSCENNTKNN